MSEQMTDADAAATETPEESGADATEAPEATPGTSDEDDDQTGNDDQTPEDDQTADDGDDGECAPEARAGVLTGGPDNRAG